MPNNTETSITNTHVLIISHVTQTFLSSELTLHSHIPESNHIHELGVYPSSSSNYILIMLSVYCFKKFFSKFFCRMKEVICKGNGHLFLNFRLKFS